MWDPVKRPRFAALREREEASVLTEAEQAELMGMIAELEDAEAAFLTPATERMRVERAQIASQNAALRELIHRKEALARRREQMVTAVKAKRHPNESAPPDCSL